MTPGDGQPLKEPLKAETPSAQEKRQSDPPQNSATSSIYTDNLSDGATTPISAQHLYAPANDAMYAPVSPTTTGPSNLMAKLTAIAPGPFALTSSKAPTQPSNYGERPPSRKDSIASNGSANTVQQGSPKAELKRQPSERTRIREEAARKLSGAGAEPERVVEKRASSNSTSGKRPSTAGSEKSTRSKRSQSSGSETSGSRAYESVSSNTAKKPEAIVEEAKLSPAEPEKPMPSPTYMAYRPAQPPQRLPRSPTFPHRPTTPQPGPAFGGARPPPPMGGPGQRIGLPSSPAQNRQNNPNNGQQPRQLPPSLLPNAGPRRPSQEPPRPLRPEDRSRTAMEPPRPMRPEDRSRTMHQLGPNDRNRSRSRDPRDQQQRRPSPSNEYHNHQPVRKYSTSSLSSSSTSASSARSRSKSTSRAPRKEMPLAGKNSYNNNNAPPLPSRTKTQASYSSSYTSSYSSPSSSSSSSQSRLARSQTHTPHRPEIIRPPKRANTDLADINSLMKDIQDSMGQHQPSTPLPHETEFPRSPLQPLSPLHLKNTPDNNSPPTAKKPAAPKGNCRGCDQPIQGKSISSSDGRLTGRYHKACFVCHTCKEPFASSEFYVFENRPYCGRHYHALNGSLCGMCGNGIEGECLETEGRERYHPACFTCTVSFSWMFFGREMLMRGGNRIVRGRWAMITMISAASRSVMRMRCRGCSSGRDRAGRGGTMGRRWRRGARG